MYKSIQFFLPPKIVFGRGSINSLPDLINENQGSVLLVTGKNFSNNTGLTTKVMKLLHNKKIIHYDEVTPEPSTDLVDAGLQIAKSEQAEVVIGLGGGSAIDVGKAIAALMNEPGTSTIPNTITSDASIGSSASPTYPTPATLHSPYVIPVPSVEDYLEGTHQQKIISSQGIPFIAVPTTAGTGAEVTKNAVLLSKTQKAKRSIRHDSLFPKVAVIDPELTLTLPPHITAQSGMDALTHLLEGYLTKNSNSITDAIALEGIKLVNTALITAVKEPENYTARERMSLAALFGGIVLANSGLGLAHGISSVLGGEFNIPHGLANAVLLPYVLEFNAESCKEKFIKIAYALSDEMESGVATVLNLATQTNEQISEFVISRIKEILKEIGIPEKFSEFDSEFDMTADDIESIAKKSLTSSSTRGNPKDVKINDIVELLMKCI
ncbi:MAG: iron-containing alcohol dehydrogenase [Elusimicrobiota bacterium]|nr:iron-containing alcohol dehydrogenase [Elusimicrobiota bacterium]